MSDELENLLSGSDDAFPESAAGDAAHLRGGNGQTAASGESHAAENAAVTPATGEPARSEPAADEPDTEALVAAEEPPKPAKPRPPRPPVEELSLEREPIKKEWYILKVQSNREDSIVDALQRRIAIEGLGDYFDEIIVPTEKVSEFKGGKKRIVKRKIYPGYIVVHMELNDDTWFLVRETPGIGDFTGSGGKPIPMLPGDVNKIIAKPDESSSEQIKNVIPFNQGDRVRIKEGTFENFEGDVDNIDPANGRVTIMINIFGRSTPVELEYYQAEKL